MAETQQSPSRQMIEYIALVPSDTSIGTQHNLENPLLLFEHERKHDSYEDCSPTGTTKRRTEAPFLSRIGNLRWWWEILSFLLVICCMSLITAILFYMDDKPLEHWKLPIQPNSLVAVFSTITKSALLYPIAECLGQLKWHYFETRRALRQMEEFDRASRGPWGATTFILRTRGTAILALTGAMLTILLLGFEPFTQQIIGFSTRVAPIPHMLGSASKTEMFAYITKRKYFDEISLYGSEDIAYPDYLLSRGVMDVVTQLDGLLTPSKNAYCPTLECHVADYTTLAACASCESEPVQMTDFNCTGNFTFSNATQISFAKFEDSQSNLREYLDSKELRSIFFKCLREYQDFPLLPLYLSMEFAKNPGSTVTLEEVSGTTVIKSGLDNVTLYQKPWQYSSRQRRNATSADDDRMVAGAYLQDCANMMENYGDHYIPLDPTRLAPFTCFNSTTDLMLYNDLQKLGQINGTISRCTIDFCAQKYKGTMLKDGHMTADEIINVPLKAPNASQFRMATYDFVAQNFNDGITTHFSIYSPARWMLISSLHGTMNNWLSWQPYARRFFHSKNGNFTLLFEGIADAVSAVLQSPHNPNTTNVTAIAYGPQVFVQVRWEWFIMPLLIVFASLLLLITTIILSRKRPYLYKTSILPTLFHGLEERVVREEGSSREEGVRETYGDLIRASKKIRVKLGKDDEGHLKLKKE